MKSPRLPRAKTVLRSVALFARPFARLSPLVLTLACAGMGAAWAQTLPVGGSVVAGSATITPVSPNVLSITQGSDRAVINWSNFSVGQTGTVNFVQPGANSITLNRVLANGGVSSIDGIVNANGRVFIVNPQGVLFGTNAQVNVGGLVASSLDLAGATEADRNASFMAGGEVFSLSGVGAQMGNGGSITATGTGSAGAGRAGLVALIGAQVVNAGVIRADGGTVALGAGEQVTLDVGNDGLTRLVIAPQANGAGPFGAQVGHRGQIQADGGRVALISSGNSSGRGGGGVMVWDGALMQANSLYARDGDIILDGGAARAGVRIEDSQISSNGVGAGERGGRIAVRGAQVQLRGATLEAQGQAGGGQIQVQAVATAGEAGTGIIRMDGQSAMRVNGQGTSDGGGIALEGQNAVLAQGRLEAQGGASGGNGGRITTATRFAGANDANAVATPVLDVAGLQVDASATAGAAGTWNINTQGLTVTHGSAVGDGRLPTASRVQDADINRALNTGTGVQVSAAAQGANPGNLVLADGVQIERSTGRAAVSLSLQAAGDLSTRTQAAIQSTSGGPMAVNLVAGTSDAERNLMYSGLLQTQGGAVQMRTGQTGAAPSGTVALTNATVDTQSGATNVGADVALTSANVALQSTQVRSGAGDILVSGTRGRVHGVDLREGPQGPTVLESATGQIRVRGHSAGTGATSKPGAGVQVSGASRIVSSVGGAVEVSGSSASGGAGVVLVAGAGQAIDTTGNVTLRAQANGGLDALQIERGVMAGNVLNLRPASVNADGSVSDAVTSPITLGGASASGFAVSGAELARLSAANVVVGSNTHAAAITVAGEIIRNGALTLQAEGSGGQIALGAPVSAAQLGLLAHGDIAQTVAAPVRAQSLLARSASGNVLLDRASNNLNGQGLGGSAGGEFRYQDEDSLTLAQVSVTGVDAASNAERTVGSGRLEADTVLVRTLAQDLTLQTHVHSQSGADLVAAERIQNLGQANISGAPWRVWADTWVGETRGPIAGSGATPNLYGCTHGGNCVVTVSPSDNHVIYTRRPTVDVQIGDASREVGTSNPAFTHAVTGGLVNGDANAALTGTLGTVADVNSSQGTYAVTGSFSSGSGYLVNVLPGTLTVTPLGTGGTGGGGTGGTGGGGGGGGTGVTSNHPPLLLPDLVRETPNTYTFDTNLGPPAMCLAAGPLDGDRAQESVDLLASEWSRVRSRPSVNNCIDTERRNTCGDF